MSDLISRQAAIEALTDKNIVNNMDSVNDTMLHKTKRAMQRIIASLPSAQPEPSPQKYARAVWTWLLNYQIKAAELKGVYSPYEVLSWVTNDWRKENGLDKQTGGD